MSSIERNIEHNFKHALDNVDHSTVQTPVSVEDMTDFVNRTTLAKLGAWSASQRLGLKHKLASMAIESIK